MTSRSEHLRWVPIVRALFGPAFIGPMALWASNAGRFVDVAIVIGAGSVVLVTGALITRRLQARHSGHLVGAQLAVLVFWTWRVVPFAWFGSAPVDVIVGFGAIWGVVVLGTRLRSFVTLPAVLGTAFGVAAIAMSVTGWLGDQPARVADVAAPAAILGSSAGADILVVILDGYTSPLVLNRDFSFEPGQTVGVLEAAGFRVQDAAWSNYSFTIDSVPSLLRLQYLPMMEDDLFLGPDPGSSRSLIAGNEGLAAWLGEIGYRTTKFESGWEDDRCGLVDRCVRASRVGGLTSWILWQRTPLRAIVGEFLLHPYPAAALSIMDELPTVIAEAGNNRIPDFIQVHIVSPHPPYALSASCEPRKDSDQSSLSVAGDTESAVDQERNGYLDQVTCINSYLEALAPIISAADMTVLITADHGSSVRGQVSKQPMSWTNDDLMERFGIFLATRTTGGCYVTSDSLVNVSREVIGCALAIDLPSLPDRHYASTPDGDGLVDVTGQLEAAKP